MTNTGKILRFSASMALLTGGAAAAVPPAQTPKVPAEFHVAAFRKPGMSDSECVRAALHAARGAAHRVLVFSGRDFLLSEAVELPSDTTVIIDNCTVKQQDGTFDNVFRGDNVQIDPEDPHGDYLGIKPLKNIRILGRGKAAIAGCDKNRSIFHPFFQENQVAVGDFFGWRTHLVHFAGLEHFEIGNLLFRQSRGWNLCFGLSAHGRLHDLEFDSQVKNGDGIDLRAGCSHIVIENISGCTRDDTIALNCSPYTPPPKQPGRYLLPGEPWKKALQNLPPEAADIHDITIRNIRAGGFYHAVILLCRGGAKIRNVTIDNVSDPGSREHHLVTLYTGYGGGYRPGDIAQVAIRNVSARSRDKGANRRAAVAVEVPVKDVLVRNAVNRGAGQDCIVTHPGGVTLENVDPARVGRELQALRPPETAARAQEQK